MPDDELPDGSSLRDGIADADAAPAGAFLTRLLRLSPAAVVRLRAPGVWAMLPFGVLVCRSLPVPAGVDATVEAAELLRALPQRRAVRRRDESWRWPLPPARDEVVEQIPAAEVIRLAAAASRTLREAMAQGVAGRAVGERALRDALLDHVAVVVTTDTGERVQVRQRLVQAIVRMGLLGRVTGPPGETPAYTDRDGYVTVRRAIDWVGLSGVHGCAWYRPISPLRLR